MGGGLVREEMERCRRGAGEVLERCWRGAGQVLERCGRVAGDVLKMCWADAAEVLERRWVGIHSSLHTAPAQGGIVLTEERNLAMLFWEGWWGSE